MGRHKSYTRAEALHEMTLLFWRKGYKATSLSDIERTTGVNRKSLINDFGTKEQMFAESLAHYLDIKAKPDGAPLFREPPSVDNVRAFFRAIRYQENEWGCLMALTILEQESAPPAAAETARGLYQQLEQALLMNLLPAVDAGHIPSPARAQDLAQFLVNTLHGIIVNGRAGATNEALRSVVEVALSVLPPDAN